MISLGYNLAISDMQRVQDQMLTIVQDIQKKVGEMYVDWKAAGFGGGSQVESDIKWINVSIKTQHYFFYFICFLNNTINIIL